MLKIGCFSSVVAFNPKSGSCAKCDLKALCEQKVKEKEEATLEAIEKHETRKSGLNPLTSDYYKLEDVEAKVYKSVAAFFKRRARGFVKRKSRIETELENMIKNGIAFDAIKSGSNPFGSQDQYEYMKLAVDCLLSFEYVKASDIAQHYQEVGAGYEKSTRRSLASKSLRILSGAGVVFKEGDIYCLVK